MLSFLLTTAPTAISWSSSSPSPPRSCGARSAAGGGGASEEKKEVQKEVLKENGVDGALKLRTREGRTAKDVKEKVKAGLKEKEKDVMVLPK